MDQNMLELNQKIDLLASQVAYLAEQAQRAELSRQSRDELLETVMPIARDGMAMVANEMQDVQEYLEPQDLVRLLKKVVRHAPQMEMLLDQIDGAVDLLEIAAPITKGGMDKATAVLGDLEKKGYFGFAQSGMKMMDTIVTSFSQEDVNRLGDNVVLILNTVKDMTQPEIMSFVRNTLEVSGREVEKPVNASMWSILGQLRDPAVRRGLALTLRVLRVVGEQGKTA
jgi:uncharacterized protein YjgD (DUF1641 family)